MSVSATVAAIQSRKAALRTEIATALSEMTKEERERQNKIIFQKLKSHKVYQESQRVSIYLSTELEVDTVRILEDLFASNKKCYVPRYDGRVMQMVLITSMADYESLPPNKWLIKQPKLKEVREDALATGGLDLIIMPGVAFTTDGKRCGHGKGYYDTFLTRVFKTQEKKPTTIAISFREQMRDDVPVHEHDVILDHVVSGDE